MTSDWTLVLETTTPQATVLLAKGEEKVAQETFFSERSQEADLFDPLQKVLAELGEEKLGTVVVGTGPGSYNGARVGIAVAQAIAQVHHADVVGISSIEGMPCWQTTDGWAVGDARRRLFFHQRIENGRQDGDVVLLKQDIFNIWRAQRSSTELFAFEKLRYPEFQDVALSPPDAETLWQSWSTRSATEKATLQQTPVEATYLRPPNITPSRKKPLF